MQGQVVAADSRRFLVETASGGVACFVRSRLGAIVCGDHVRVRLGAGADDGVIEELLPRSSLVLRSDARREKPIAANVSQAVIVCAANPRPNLEFVDRCLAAAEHAGIAAILVLNKMDLDESAAALSALEPYRGLGYTVLPLCARNDAEPLQQRLRGHSSVLIGPSGVGKSTLLNALVPAARARTGELSRTAAGRHTTTGARLYRLDAETSVIDSPGMQAFGLQHVPPDELALAFAEFRPFLGQCRFGNCRHAGEPDCALDAACAAGRISVRRLDSYRALLRSIAPQPGR